MRHSTQTLWDAWLNESATRQTRHTRMIVANKTNSQNTNSEIPEMLSLDKCHGIDESVVDSIRSIEALGKEKFREYQKSVILYCTRSIYDPLKGTPLHFLKGQNPGQ